VSPAECAQSPARSDSWKFDRLIERGREALRRGDNPYASRTRPTPRPTAKVTRSQYLTGGATQEPMLSAARVQGIQAGPHSAQVTASVIWSSV
jgi:hypothetical protein